MTPPAFWIGGRTHVRHCPTDLRRDGDTRLDSGTTWWLIVMGRLKPGVSLARASALSAASAGIFEATLPADYPPVSVKPYLVMKLFAIPAGNGISRMRDDDGEGMKGVGEFACFDTSNREYTLSRRPR